MMILGGVVASGSVGNRGGEETRRAADRLTVARVGIGVEGMAPTPPTIFPIVIGQHATYGDLAAISPHAPDSHRIYVDALGEGYGPFRNIRTAAAVDLPPVRRDWNHEGLVWCADGIVGSVSDIALQEKLPYAQLVIAAWLARNRETSLEADLDFLLDTLAHHHDYATIRDIATRIKAARKAGLLTASAKENVNG